MFPIERKPLSLELKKIAEKIIGASTVSMNSRLPIIVNTLLKEGEVYCYYHAMDYDYPKYLRKFPAFIKEHGKLKNSIDVYHFTFSEEDFLNSTEFKEYMQRELSSQDREIAAIKAEAERKLLEIQKHADKLNEGLQAYNYNTEQYRA